jgi:hypothetical protein
MGQYACRNDDHSMTPPPLGKSRQDVFCSQCPSRPYKSTSCVMGLSEYALEHIEIVADSFRRQKAMEDSAAHDRYCILCNMPLIGARAIMHQSCRSKISAMMRQLTRDGEVSTREAAIDRLQGEGVRDGSTS